MADPVLMWLVVGAGLIIVEVVTAPGLGLFLGGLGALTTAIIVELGIITAVNTPAQFAWFFGLTSVWSLLLWSPLKKFRSTHGAKGSDHPKVQDIVGSTAVIGRKGLRRGDIGQAHWSGTIMSATLDEGTLDDFLPEGTQVRINSVTGTVLNVSPIIRS